MGTMIFQRISDAIWFILSSQNISVCNYIDIFAAVESNKGKENLKDICSTITNFNEDKVQGPCEALTIMGIEVNVHTQTLAIPQGKMADILVECNNFAEKASFNKKELQSLLGKLLYVSKIVKPALRSWIEC